MSSVLSQPLRLSDLAARLADHVLDQGDGLVILDVQDRERVVQAGDVEIEDEGRDARLRNGDQVWRITSRPA